MITRAIVSAIVVTASLAEARPHHDSYDTPTDTHVDLVVGLWHDDALALGEGWHLYHFTAVASGYVAFQMRSPPGADTLWPYVRIVDRDESWAGVGNRRTNLCEVIVHVERGHRYDVIATSQRNARLGPRDVPDAKGVYTIGVVPVALP